MTLNVCLELDNILRAPQEYPQHNNFRRSSVSLTYFRPPAARDTPHYWNDEHRWIEPWVRIARDSYLTPEIVYAPMPENSRWSDAETAVLQEAFWPENFGHSMGDDFLPVFRLARSFGLWSRSDLQVIMHPPCWDRGHPTRGCAHHAELSNLLLARPLEDYNTSLFNAPPPFEGRACFRNLLVGTRRLGMGFPSEHVWPEFVRELRVGAGLDPLARPNKQKVVLLHKVGRRTVRNYDEVEDALRMRFEVDVEVVNPEELSLVEQLERMQQTTVVVSPCGGVSFSAMFLPAGSSAVFIDYWDARWNTTAQMERFIYTYNDNVMPFYYPVEKRDLHLDRSKLPDWVDQKDEYEVWRNWPDVTVDVKRMERYVFSALLHAEVSYGWHDSFRMESPTPLT
ncbi:hypothetical protein Rhopal_007412-T1 [Rhodotorula paludigena]|uniref:Glycosyltransferase 61 catalytic domain-containing protein n=1 Tax=Rhodotorula paludigena TaxID=86838 RepID=A0AAV5GVS5_9BASI|nr:hypothetical protein Rhopal_007412-T1 [Rhodotorula paludigena]